MKKHFLLLPVLCLAFSAQLFAADAQTRDDKADSVVVANALAQVNYLKGEPDPNAKYYIYLHSASWCGPCCKGMPGIVSKYKELKEKGFEIILFGHDGTDGEVVAFAARFHAEFPMLRDSPELASKVPGYKKITRIPRIIVVDRSGKKIVETHPGYFFPNDQWKKYIPQEEGTGQEPAAAAPME